MKKKAKILLIILPIILIIGFIGFGLCYKADNNKSDNNAGNIVKEEKKETIADTSVEQLFFEQTFELGEVNISPDLKDYISTSDYMYNKAFLDTSNVDENVVGDYTIFCTVDKRKYSYTIHIVDTTAPTFLFNEVNKVYGTNSTYSIIEEFLEKAIVEDLSEVSDILLVSCTDHDGNSYIFENNEFSFETQNTYTFSFEVSDVFGNNTNENVSIEVLDPPHFVLLNDRQYMLNEKFKLLDFVFAYDRDGNDITNNIVVLDDDGYDASIPKDYHITYSVSDETGLTKNETITIRVGKFKKNSFGFDNTPENLKLLVDSGYFKYEPLIDNTDMKAVIDYTQYASFGIKDKNAWGAEGLIFRITENYIYFMTAIHCDFKKYSLTHFVDYRGHITIVDLPKITIIKSPTDDLEIGKIPVSEFKLSDLLTYKEVLVDLDLYEKMNIGDKVVVNSQAFGYKSFQTLKDISTIGSIVYFDVNTIEDYTYKHNYHYLMASKASKPGQSGSPVFNSNGFLVGVCRGVFSYPAKKIYLGENVPLSAIKALVDTIEFE